MTYKAIDPKKSIVPGATWWAVYDDEMDWCVDSFENQAEAEACAQQLNENRRKAKKPTKR